MPSIKSSLGRRRPRGPGNVNFWRRASTVERVISNDNGYDRALLTNRRQSAGGAALVALDTTAALAARY